MWAQSADSPWLRVRNRLKGVSTCGCGLFDRISLKVMNMATSEVTTTKQQGDEGGSVPYYDYKFARYATQDKPRKAWQLGRGLDRGSLFAVIANVP